MKKIILLGLVLIVLNVLDAITTFSIPYNLKDNILIQQILIWFLKQHQFLNSYLTDDKRYAGMIVTCKEQEGKIFVLNNDKNEWLTFDSSLYEKNS